MFFRFFTTRQRNWGRLMCVCSQGRGSHVTISHEALDLTIRGLWTPPWASPPLQTPLTVQGSLEPSPLTWTSLYRVPPASNIWWASLDTSLNYSLQDPPSPVLTSGGYWSMYGWWNQLVYILLECFFVLFCFLLFRNPSRTDDDYEADCNKHESVGTN